MMGLTGPEGGEPGVLGESEPGVPGESEPGVSGPGGASIGAVDWSVWPAVEKVSTPESRRLTNIRSPGRAKLLTRSGMSGERSRTGPGWLAWLAVGGLLDTFSALLLLFDAVVASLPLVCIGSFGSPADWFVILEIPQRARSGPSAEAPPQLAT